MTILHMLTRNINGKLLNIIIGATLIAFGVFIGFYVLLYFITAQFTLSSIVDLTLDPTDILSLLVTVVLAVYVTGKLSKKNEEERAEKDLLIEDIKKFKDGFSKDLNEVLNSSVIELTRVTATFKIFRMKLNAMTNLVGEYDFREAEAKLKSLDEKVRDIRDLLTDTPQVSSTKKAGIIISAGNISLESETRYRIESNINDIASGVFGAVVAINRN